MHNEDMRGREAPALAGGTWIGSDEAEVAARQHAKTWRMLVFFLPH